MKVWSYENHLLRKRAVLFLDWLVRRHTSYNFRLRLNIIYATMVRMKEILCKTENMKVWWSYGNNLLRKRAVLFLDWLVRRDTSYNFRLRLNILSSQYIQSNSLFFLKTKKKEQNKFSRKLEKEAPISADAVWEMVWNRSNCMMTWCDY